MKFIKTYKGDWINLESVKHFAIELNTFTTEGYFIKADGINIHRVDFDLPPNARVNFLSEEAARLREIARKKAQAWLDNLVAELNGESN